jgi:Ca-activated chloride channel homolog
MAFTFDTRWPLLLLLSIPYLWWIQRNSVIDVERRQMRLLTCLRSAVVALLVLALMQPVLYRSKAFVSVVYMLDVSQSVAPAAVQSAIQWIQSVDASGMPAHRRFIPFAANSVVLENLDKLNNVAIDRSATNLEDAIDKAADSFATNALKRLVLITDGNETSGDMMRAVSRLKQAGVRTYTIPLQVRTDRDVRVESVLAPSDVAEEELFPVAVYVYSQIETAADIHLNSGANRLDSRRVDLQPGINRVQFDTKMNDQSGPVTLEAVLDVSGDVFADNNKFRTSVVVHGRPRVLYVEGRFESARFLHTALTGAGLSVTTVRPASIPSTASGLDVFDAVVLSDVARSSVTGQQVQAIASYVRDLGGGLIIAGGENVYGESGYSETSLEDILPVTFEVKKQKPVAMIIVLDRSESMTGLKMQLAKEATKAPVELLNDTDYFGVVAFNAKFFWAVPFQSATKKQEITQAVGSINAVGETDIYPAMEAAYKQLEKDATEIKHVILLSDGKTFPDDFQSLVAKMSAAKITISTVAVGTSADRDLLANIANWGGGRTYYLVNPSRVPQIFVDETELTKGKALREDPFIPLVKKPAELFKGIDFETAPPLLGYVATRPKQSAEVLLESSRHDPILARWQYGLGKTAAFMSDAKNRWALDWLRWNGYAKFWSQLVRQTMRERDNAEFDFRVSRNGIDADVTLESLRGDGAFRNKLDMNVRIVAPDQSVSDVSIAQTGPGSYAAKVPLAQPGDYTFRALGPSGALASRTLEYSYPAEYHFFPPNTEMLHAISKATGGRVQPKPEEIFATNGETTRVPLPLWPYLAATALVLYISEVVLRRLRLFRENHG